MSHSVHPYSHRLGIIRDWKSRWFGMKDKYRANLRGDIMLREYLTTRLRDFFVSGVEIERNEKHFRIIIRTARPGMLLGKSGEGITNLKKDLDKQIKRLKLAVTQNIKIDVEEVRSPESNAAILARMVAEALEKRLPFRRVMKQIIDKAMANRDVLGVKIYCGGRLGGADMARTEALKKGRIPLQTLRADIDFARDKAHMTYGDLGIKVWVYRGEIFNANLKNQNAK
ncbi:MAG: 30S ribosomal protein S3 [Candidatus Taylorbacteria bacterium RIFCSPHIGHO2_02_FULL_46_13]|uniref:Small ribosomal subunit protein uS3 n=1 Tax=Candidatus Taylorbacteria bacterium RIFCSPHIGHO2_02_FULL_46_13 TaxID=1802312 RepID=A0A1G2MQ45_9BACT|nr:MAG: 30S ribosomal protein S3 [Candidatus Taylorbacteria bacterium RIFCSPHIGHO2_02_FULL_46_13]